MSRIQREEAKTLPADSRSQTGYTFYMSVSDGGRDEGTHKKVLGAHVEIYETQRLQESATYEFWLTASTKAGEGEKTKVVKAPPNNKVPARIISFSRVSAFHVDTIDIYRRLKRI